MTSRDEQPVEGARRLVKSSEPWRLPPDKLELLDEVTARVQPDEPSLVEWVAKYGRQHRHRLAGDLRLVELHVAPGARLLEYGAVPLIMTAALSRLDYRVSALDVAPERFGAAIESLGLDVRKVDVETEAAPFPSDSFDAVLFNELFEHLRINPIVTMREVHRLLKPGGVLLLSTPNLRSMRGLRNLLLHNQAHAASADVYRQYEKLETLGHMGHVREYTTREVSDFLVHCGFHIDELVYRGGHGKGVVGLVERLAPSLRPFFALVARKAGARGGGGA